MKKRVLYVEDDEALVKIGALILTSQGFEVVDAFSGAMAIEKISAEKFDLVLLDVLLPDIDGFEVCRHIRGNPRTTTIPIIMLTGKDSQEDRDRGNFCGASSYLFKPFNATTVINEINKQLSLSNVGNPVVDSVGSVNGIHEKSGAGQKRGLFARFFC